MLGNVCSQLQSNVGKPTFVLWRPRTNPFPPAKKQLTSESDIILVSEGTKGKIASNKKYKYPYSIRITHISLYTHTKKNREGPWKRWVWSYSTVMQHSQANWKTKWCCGLASWNQSLATFKFSNPTFSKIKI